MNPEYFGNLSIIGMKGSERFVKEVDRYICEWRREADTYMVSADCPRFGTGEAKGIINESLRGHDTFIYADVFNYGVEYTMQGRKVPMSPDDHFQDLKRIIGAIGGKARRISVIMPMLYEGRQHKRSARESLDCALALQELERMGVSNILTFDAHDARVQNAIPLSGFDNIRPTYQMLKAMVNTVPDIEIDPEKTMIVSPDEGGMSRSMYYSSVLGLPLGMFYKRRNYAVVIDGRNPIEAHEFLGKSVKDKDVIVVDDMISSGDSILEVAGHLKERGAKRIFIFVSFALFCNGLEKMDKAYQEGLINKIFATNLIYRSPELLSREWYCDVNMCKMVALIIDTLNKDMTISTLLNPVNKIHALADKIAARKGEK